MSTQTSSAEIPLTISHPQQNLRLLELPPELLDLLSAPRPPRLYFKSSSTRTSDRHAGLLTSAEKAAEHLHLCTQTQSYQVRQVSTSNSVYIIEPSNARPASREGDDGMEFVETLAQLSSGMTAIAKVDTMLELLPVSYEVKPMLARILPLYQASEALSSEEAKSHFSSHSTPASRSALFSEILVPDSQAEQAWRDLLAFEFEGRCARPSASTSLSVWQSVINYATLERVDLTGDVNFKSFFKTEHASPIDPPVGEAILFYLDDRNFPNSTAHSMHLDHLKVVCWTGLTYLQARSEKPGTKPQLLNDDYISQWQDLLPEAWRADATLERLPEGCYTIDVVEGKEVITWSGFEGSGSERQQTATSEEAKTTSGKRKWHEKFQAQRKETKK